MITVNPEGSWLLQQAENIRDRIAVISAESRLSYGELYEASISVAGALTDFGIMQNDHVAVISNNSLDYVIVLHALWLKGCTPVTINPQLKEGGLAELLDHSEARFVIMPEGSYTGFDGVECISIKDLMKHSNNAGQKIESSNEAVLIYTSGTSGGPKGVPVKLTSLYNSAVAIDAINDYNINDKFLLSLPLYHIGGFSIFVRSLLAGAALIIPEELNLSNISSILASAKPTIVSLVPTMLKTLVDNDAVLPDSIRIIYVGGGPADESMIEKAIDLKYPIAKVYGSTEACAMITYAGTEILKDSPGSSGRVFGKSKIKIVNKDGTEAEPLSSGEIVIESDSLFSEYYRNESETSRKLVNGKYFSGDIGYTDEEGNLFVVSRRDDLIVTGGENVYPPEIVNEINRHPAVVDSAVFGVDDAHWGQMVCAAVIIRYSGSDIAEEIKQFLGKELPSYKIPKQIFIVEDLHHNSMGKVNISELKRSLNLDV